MLLRGRDASVYRYTFRQLIKSGKIDDDFAARFARLLSPYGHRRPDIEYQCYSVSAIQYRRVYVGRGRAGQVHTYRRIASSIGIIYLSLPTYCASYGRHSADRHPRAPT